jgi:peptidoglycan hydrolase-like protein with peptidoglycan-binding domain
MKPEASFLNQPIRSLQTMLRTLAEFDSRHETLIPDGIYGPSTKSAVSKFQRLHGLAVTGVTDQQTWEQIVAEYEPALIQIAQAQMLDVILEPNQIVRQGEQHPHIYIVQAILAVLQDAYASIGPVSHTGMLDEATSNAIAAFQGLSGLPMTGNLDKVTWKHLALQYSLAANAGLKGTIFHD